MYKVRVTYTKSKEAAYISGLLAAELGENVSLAKRAGLLHDIGRHKEYETGCNHHIASANLAEIILKEAAYEIGNLLRMFEKIEKTKRILQRTCVYYKQNDYRQQKLLFHLENKF